MADATTRAWDELQRHARELALLTSADAALQWDERTMLPQRAGPYRAEQLTLLASLIHERRTDPRVGDWLATLADSPFAADPHSDSGADIRRLRHEYEKARRLPRRLVEELARATTLGQQAWVEARQADDFPRFLPHLETIVRLRREQCDAIGHQGVPYDVLLDDYEPDARTETVAAVLQGLCADLVPLIQEIVGSGRHPDRDLLRKSYPVATQAEFGRAAATAIGFRFDAGRLDETHHPFCTTLGPYDCRITTRYDEHYLPSSLFGILHEAGHGIYEQGLRPEQFGLPSGSAASLGIHESQSRMWENFVGRSLACWRHWFPEAQRAFPQALGDVGLDAFYHAINDVRPSLIRVEADEATYNLHIALRFELERELIDGRLAVADLPAAWNAKYEQYLGIAPPSDADGVLQDIHWSAGLIGYFPTYSLGNVYAAQLFAAARRDLDDLDALLAAGDFTPLREWLVEHVHRHGQCYSAEELVRRATGEGLRHQPLIDYLRGKLAPLYGL